MEQDLELPPDMAPAAGAVSEAAEFAAPTAGVPAAQRWIQAGVLAADHVAAGAFDSAMRLLNRRACLAPLRLSLSFMALSASAPLQPITGLAAGSAVLTWMQAGSPAQHAVELCGAANT